MRSYYENASDLIYIVEFLFFSNISNIKMEIKNEALIREELSDDQNPKYNVYTLDANGKLCEYGLSEETIEIKSKHILHQEKEMNPKLATSSDPILAVT